MKIRLTTFARPDDDLLTRFTNRYLSGGKTWKDLEFVSDESYDRLVILTYPHKDTLEKGYEKNKALTFMTEPTLSYYAKSHPTEVKMKIHLHLPFFPKNFSLYREIGEKVDIDIIEQKKDKLLSVVVSELSGLPGHRTRLEFVHVMDQLIADGLDIYGRPFNGNYFSLLANYRGFLPDKYDGLWQYLYHLACENSFENGYFTEKLIDPIVTETLCFYDGCPNIEEFVDPRAYVKINIHNIEEALGTIVKTINDQEWKKRYPFIARQKTRFLTDLHPLNLIWMAVHDRDVDNIYTCS
ncbi:glycosyltransferase family 10 [Sphingobacterium sp. ML3W]|uniref:glycosyltransferase family 10 domain-containing protein n=1 Tax=Sphingobacterium sp. ML3W TaxID=1538644 RepID=UPI00249A3E71|nr:glycosyltransferase family 10 [Sphingobacterium sp. ML3W]WFA79546.1 glycosyltransferase family 10 [Sphingobacterium sp. ML3W]